MPDLEIRTDRITANGLEFHLNVCGEGDRLALCLHGFPELGHSWRNQLPLLASLGYRVWAPDMRGYGQSDKPEGLDAYAIERLVEDVGALIDASGARETTLIAHDWGGIIAWQFAAHRVRPLERLVVMNGPAPGIGRRPRFRQILRTWYVFFLQIPRLPEWVFSRRNHRLITTAFTGATAIRKERFPPEVVEVYREGAARPGALTAMIHYYRGLLRGGGFRRMTARGFPVVETPTLLVWGEDDPILVPSTLEGAGEWLKDWTLRFIPRAGHWVQQEAPDEVNEILAAWLRDEPVPGQTEPGPEAAKR